MQRIRLNYSKGDELKFTGNLDMMRVWERSFRRAGLVIAYSQGFHPQPKIHQALPLPLGFTSENDLLDFWLVTDENLSLIRDKLEKALQPGITIQDYQVIPSGNKPLQTIVTAASYSVVLDALDPALDLSEKINWLLNKTECQRERRGKHYDLLPLIQSLSVPMRNARIILMTLSALPSATGRPEEVLDELGIPLQDVSIKRTKLHLSE